MLVLVKDSAETLVSSYIQPGDLVGIADRRGQWSARSGIPDSLWRGLGDIATLAVPGICARAFELPRMELYFNGC